MKNKQHIRRCPFCGGKASLYEDYSSWWHVQCDNCGATTLKRRSGEEAILHWNKRVEHDEA